MNTILKKHSYLMISVITLALSSCKATINLAEPEPTPADSKQSNTMVPATPTATPPKPTATPTPTPKPSTPTPTPVPATPTPSPASTTCTLPVVDDPALDGVVTAYPLSFKYSTTDAYKLGHYVYLPKDYSKDPCKKWPLVFFMHGLGELGNGTMSTLPNILKNNSPLSQINNGKAAENSLPFLNAIVVQAQGFKDGTDINGNAYNGWNSWSASAAKGLVDYIRKVRRVDDDRIYITGLSLGGGGTMSFAKSYPTVPAAVVPVCPPDTSSSTAAVYTNLPLWAFHNFTDGTVSRSQLENQINSTASFLEDRVMQNYPFGANKSMASTNYTARPIMGTTHSKLPSKWKWDGGIDPSDTSRTPLVTIFNRSSHDAWTAAYNNKAMWEWMFAQVKKPAADVSVSSFKAYSASGISITAFPAAAGAALTFEAQISGPASEVVIDLRNIGGISTGKMTSAGSGLYRASFTIAPGALIATKSYLVTVTVASSKSRAGKNLKLTAQ